MSSNDSKQAWVPCFGRQDYRLVNEETAFQGYFRVKRLTLEHKTFSGQSIEITRELFQRGDAVCVLLYDPAKDRVVLVEQFRVGSLQGPSPWMLEVVAGVVEEGETSEQVAKRESIEEAGLTIGEPKRIIRYLPSGGGCDEWIDLLYAEVDSDQANGIHGLPEEGEDIRVHVLSSDDAIALVNQGIINSSPAIIGLQWLALNKLSLQGAVDA
jgi:ADP-ribose pyrophosphatase